MFFINWINRPCIKTLSENWMHWNLFEWVEFDSFYIPQRNPDKYISQNFQYWIFRLEFYFARCLNLRVAEKRRKKYGNSRGDIHDKISANDSIIIMSAECLRWTQRQKKKDSQRAKKCILNPWWSARGVRWTSFKRAQRT